MKKLMSTPCRGFDESASVLHIYEIGSEEEWLEINARLEDGEESEILEELGFVDSLEYGVMPGGTYYMYDFSLVGDFGVVCETIGLNV